jgi:hypothetical protein
MLGRLRELAGSVLDAPVWQSLDAEACAAVAAGFAAVQQVQAAWLSLVRDLDRRPDAVPGARPGLVARTFLRHALNRAPGQARLDVDAAYALDRGADPAAGGLPGLGAAFAAGEVSREHVDTAVRAVRQIPARLLAQPGDGGGCAGDLVDQVLTGNARGCDSRVLGQLTAHLLDAVDPDGARSFDPDASERRSLTLTQDGRGMFLLRGELDQPGSTSPAGPC